MMNGYSIQLYTYPEQINPPWSHWSAILILSSVLFDVAGGCIRRNLFHPDSSRSVVNHKPEVSTGVKDTIRSSHKQDCFPEEIPVVNCLHGGMCFAVVFNGIRQTSCHCTSEWTGRRCEQVFIDPKLLATKQRRITNANIAAGVSVCMLVLLAAAFAAFVKFRYKRKKKYLENREFEASAEELYRQPFNKRSSVVESFSRKGTLRRSAEQKQEGVDGILINSPVSPADIDVIPYIDDDIVNQVRPHSSAVRMNKMESAL